MVDTKPGPAPGFVFVHPFVSRTPARHLDRERRRGVPAGGERQRKHELERDLSRHRHEPGLHQPGAGHLRLSCPCLRDRQRSGQLQRPYRDGDRADHARSADDPGGNAPGRLQKQGQVHIRPFENDPRKARPRAGLCFCLSVASAQIDHPHPSSAPVAVTEVHARARQRLAQRHALGS